VPEISKGGTLFRKLGTTARLSYEANVSLHYFPGALRLRSDGSQCLLRVKCEIDHRTSSDVNVEGRSHSAQNDIHRGSSSLDRRTSS
ncbi:unnamed protein product, partial [Heterotrigona itama]